MPPRIDRHVAVAVIVLPVLLVALSMLARTELFLGERIRTAVERRAGPLGADVEIVTVGPDGLWGIELRGVSARVPRGDFALEVVLDSVVVTPSLASLLSGPIDIEELELQNGAVAIVPWSAPNATDAKKAKATTPSKPKSSDTTPKAKPEPPRPIDVTFENVELVAYSDRYEVLPLRLTRLDFAWRRGAPIQKLAGYGALPDGVEFSIVAKDDAYWVRPQRPTRIDRWVAPRGGGVGWPVSLSTRDIRICVDCESVLRLEDVAISVPRWRKDIQLTAPSADVWRKGRKVGLGAPEMAIVDTTTREFAARLTETDFRYALDTGRLAGLVELADRAGGRLEIGWTWNAEDFDVRFDAENFLLASVWHLFGLGDLARPHEIAGEAAVGWDLRHETLGVEVNMAVDRLGVRLPYTDEVFELSDARFELDSFFDLGGRAASIRRAALTVADTAPLVARASIVDASKGASFDIGFLVERQPVGPLVAALPEQWTAAFRDAVFTGDVGFEIGAAGHSAFPESLQLTGSIDSSVEVETEGSAADVSAIGRAGPPPDFRGDWTSLAAIGEPAWSIVLAAEDAGFFSHDGFSWGGIERAMVHNLKVGRPERGGSTITQQVVKNLFLDGKRTLTRKLQEAYLTWRIEAVVPKKRILEIYLNIADMGPNTRGIAAASQRFFDADAHELDPIEVAMLAAILPNPHRFGRWIEDGFLATSRLEKIEHILANLRYLDQITPETYRRLWAEAQSGKIGRLQLGICSDDGKPAPRTCGK